MPEQPAGFDPREAERLDQAIDSIMAGAVPPASGDARLDLLVALAARLHRELPRDLPDPAFRARLKEDLTSRLPLVPPVSRRPSPFRRHLPVYGSLAAVFVVALVAGALAFWPEEDQPTTATTGARLEQAPFAATTAFTPPTETFASDIVTRTAEAATSMTTALLAPTATLVPAAATEPAASESPSPTATTAQQPTQPAAPGSATVFQASLPEIDPATVEEGPVPAADGGGSGPSTDVTYVMAATAPDLGTSATVYRLSPPAEDPVTFCRELAAKAGIPSDDVRSTAESGRTEVFAGEPGAGTVYWRPDAGVFQLSGDAVAGEGDLEPDAVGSRALDWLASIGYPVGTLGEPRVDDLGELWLVEFPYAGLPAPGVGHPLGVTLMLQRDGTVAEAHGYWLALDREEPLPLVSVADAWAAVTHGGGYWRDGGMSSEGGEFRVEAVRLSTVLTSAGAGLVLQPAIEFSGTFTTADGRSSAPISVFVQAAGD